MQDKFFLDIRDPDLLKKMGGLYDAVNAEDPLPCALICAAYIDKCLLGILESTLRGGETAKKIMKTDVGLLGSLSARARLLYLMEVIDDFLLQNIDVICRVRNLFAHSHEPLTFDSDAVVKVCAELKHREPLITISTNPEVAHNMDRLRSMPKFRFIDASLMCINELLMITAGLVNEPRPVEVADPTESQ